MSCAETTVSATRCSIPRAGLYRNRLVSTGAFRPGEFSVETILRVLDSRVSAEWSFVSGSTAHFTRPGSLAIHIPSSLCVGGEVSASDEDRPVSVFWNDWERVRGDRFRKVFKKRERMARSELGEDRNVTGVRFEFADGTE